MIASLDGVLVAQDDSTVVVGVGGVGLRVRVPTTVLDQAGSLGSRISLHTHLHVRENELALYGFTTEAELDLFEQLLNVKGVGPRMAIGILSRISPETLRSAIAAGQVDVLTQVPGVGRRTAQQMIVDLKGKLDLASVGVTGATAGFGFADAVPPAQLAVVAAQQPRPAALFHQQLLRQQQYVRAGHADAQHDRQQFGVA